MIADHRAMRSCFVCINENTIRNLTVQALEKNNACGPDLKRQFISFKRFQWVWKMIVLVARDIFGDWTMFNCCKVYDIVAWL